VLDVRDITSGCAVHVTPAAEWCRSGRPISAMNFAWSQNIRVLFEDGRTDPRVDHARASSSKSADALFAAGKIASFRMQVSGTTRAR
jgi:hypothetical protein